MRVFINRKGKYAESVDCHLEPCRRNGTIRTGDVLFTLHRYTSEPPFDDVVLLHLHPECFLIWCLEVMSDKKGLDKDSEALLEMLPKHERLVQVR